MALSVSDIDFVAKTIHITKNLYNSVPGPTKTKAGVRRVPMPNILIKGLKDYLAYHDDDVDILFPSRVGTYINNSSRNGSILTSYSHSKSVILP